jgi:phosphopantothenoylcysteine decarboxylase/phosphopantothenate--cysteine ligase
MKAKNWIVGITGGIAAYKTPELIRLLIKQGAQVRVVLSEGAEHFVTPLTLQAVSGQSVYRHLFDEDFEAAMGHINLARWAEGILIAPLTANRLAALAHGMADDLLTTLCLASQAPLYVAPAMNRQMWEHPATQANMAILRERGVHILGPDWGEQACKEIGWGRMVEPQSIVEKLLTPSEKEANLKALRILISAGPTREPIDPVRYISNRSSGKMGYALAKAARARGADVTLVTGPVNLPAPPEVKTIAVTTAKEMQEAVLKEAQSADIYISAAAVADFRVEKIAAQKIKKQDMVDAHWQLNLIQNEDILKQVSALSNRPYCVGFAAETENDVVFAKTKLQEKKLDMIAVNDVSRSDIGFDAPENAIQVLTPEKIYSLAKALKSQIADNLLDIIKENYDAKNKTKNT